MGTQQVIKLAETLIAQGVKKARYVTPTCRVGTAEQLGLKLEQIASDTVQIRNKTPLGEFLSYMKRIEQEGKSFKPTFENPNSAFAQYYASTQSGMIKRKIVIANFKNYIFKNADTLNVSKEEYYQLIDEIAANVKKEVMNNPNGLRKEFVENADKIHKWAEIFATQHYENGKNIYNKFYDEQMFNEAVKQYKEFVEQITKKKVFIGCPSRMNFPISALGMLNNPSAYKDIDFILFGHGKGSSLITDITHSDTWRFSDNDKSIWDYIEKVCAGGKKGKKGLVFCCETDGLRKAGVSAADMVDRNGQQMYGIGGEVFNDFKEKANPVKICQSGIRHIIGQMSETGKMAKDSPIGQGVLTQGKGCPVFSLAQVDNPKTIMYDLDFDKYRVENLV